MLNVHDKSLYKIRKFPRCSRCKKEFVMVLSRYEKKKDLIWEWECVKCGKVVNSSYLKEENLSDEDKFLSNWCKDEQSKQKNSRDPLSSP